MHQETTNKRQVVRPLISHTPAVLITLGKGWRTVKSYHKTPESIQPACAQGTCNPGNHTPHACIATANLVEIGNFSRTPQAGTKSNTLPRPCRLSLEQLQKPWCALRRRIRRAKRKAREARMPHSAHHQLAKITSQWLNCSLQSAGKPDRSPSARTFRRGYCSCSGGGCKRGSYRPSRSSVSLVRAVMTAGTSAHPFQSASRCSSATSCVRASGNRGSLCPLKLMCFSEEVSDPMSDGSLVSYKHAPLPRSSSVVS